MKWPCKLCEDLACMFFLVFLGSVFCLKTSREFIYGLEPAKVIFMLVYLVVGREGNVLDSKESVLNSAEQLCLHKCLHFNSQVFEIF